jgi:endonuclease YncB( thermonuclease family)
MLRTARLAVTTLVATALLAPAASLASPSVTQKGVVTAVLDGRTVQVSLSTGKTERVQLVGLAPVAASSCVAAQANADLTHLAAGQPVWLVAEPGRSAHNAGASVVAYVFLPGGIDLGLELVKRGDAAVAAKTHPFKRVAAYLSAQAAAKASSSGLWACNSTTPAAPSHGHQGGSSGQGDVSADGSAPAHQGNGQDNGNGHGHGK